MGSDRKDAEGFSREGELVYITKWVKNKGILRDELESKFDGYVKLVKVDDLVTKDVRLIDGTGTLHLALVDGAEIENWAVPAGWTLPRAISIQFSRNITIRRANIGNAAVTTPGNGYGIQSQRSVKVHITGVYADGVRHAVNVFSGANVFVGGVWGTNMAGAVVDTHGYGARKVWFVGIHSKANIAVGNRAKWGDEVEIQDSQAGMLWSHGAVKVKVFDSHFSGPAGFQRNAFGEPAIFEATRCTFTAFSTTKAIHFEGTGPFAVVPKLTDVKLVEWAGG